MAKKFGTAPGVYLIMEHEDEALFLHRNNTGYLDGIHMLPGGGVEPGEQPTKATIREALEEVDIEPLDLVMVHVMYRAPHDETGVRLDIFFRSIKWHGEPKIMEPHKCDGLKWLPLDNLPDSVPPYVRSAIKLSRKGVRYSEFDWHSYSAMR